MDRKRNTKTRGKRTLRQKTVTKIRSDAPSQIINLSRYKLCPPRVLVRLGYQNGYVLAHAAGSQTSKAWNANGCFDVDPSLGNLTFDGFDQWMALYGVYRTIRFIAKITAINNESFPVRISTCFFPQFTSSYPLTSWNNQRAIEHACLGAKGGIDRTVIRREISLAELVGVEAYEGDLQQYYGTTGTNPQSIASFNIGIAGFSSTFLTNGVSLALEYEMILELAHPEQIEQV